MQGLRVHFIRNLVPEAHKKHAQIRMLLQAHVLLVWGRRARSVKLVQPNLKRNVIAEHVGSKITSLWTGSIFLSSKLYTLHHLISNLYPHPDVLELESDDRRNVWASEFKSLPDLPKLGDFSDDYKTIPPRFIETVDLISKNLMNKWSKYPRKGSARERVVGQKLAERLRKVPTPTCQLAASYLEKGVPMKSPSTDYPIKELANQKMTIEERVRTRYAFAKGIAKGWILGPFPYRNQTHAVVRDENRTTVNKLRGTECFWAWKGKTQQKIGRFITNSKKSLLNKNYDKKEVDSSLRDFKKLVHDFRDGECFSVCDFKAAYKQIHTNLESWGQITYLFEGNLFIDTRITFGIVLGAGWFITIPNACIEMYTYEKWKRLGILKERLQEIEETQGKILRGRQSFHIDDGKYTGTDPEVREWIEYWTEIDLGYLGTDSAIE